MGMENIGINPLNVGQGQSSFLPEGNKGESRLAANQFFVLLLALLLNPLGETTKEAPNSAAEITPLDQNKAPSSNWQEAFPNYILPLETQAPFLDKRPEFPPSPQAQISDTSELQKFWQKLDLLLGQAFLGQGSKDISPLLSPDTDQKPDKISISKDKSLNKADLILFFQGIFQNLVEKGLVSAEEAQKFLNKMRSFLESEPGFKQGLEQFICKLKTNKKNLAETITTKGKTSTEEISSKIENEDQKSGQKNLVGTDFSKNLKENLDSNKPTETIVQKTIYEEKKGLKKLEKANKKGNLEKNSEERLFRLDYNREHNSHILDKRITPQKPLKSLLTTPNHAEQDVKPEIKAKIDFSSPGNFIVGRGHAPSPTEPTPMVFRAPGPLTPAQVPEFVKEMILRVGQNGRHEVRLKLEPPHLGELRIDLSIDKGEVKLLFTVEHPQAAQALHQELHLLAKALNEAGLNFGGCDINLGGGHTPYQENPKGQYVWASNPRLQEGQRPTEEEVKTKRGLVDLHI